MAKYIEKNGPFLVTFITVVFSWCYIDYIFPLLQPKAENITNITITLASVFLSFIGAMYGVLISLKDDPLVKHLNKYNIISLIRHYTQISFYSNCIALIVSFWFLISNTDTNSYGKYEIIVQLSLLIFTCCASFRMLRILGAFVQTIEHKKEEIHIPSLKKNCTHANRSNYDN